MSWFGKGPKKDFDKAANGQTDSVLNGVNRGALLASTEAGNSNSATFSAALGLMKPFWGNPKRYWPAYVALGSIVGLMFAQIGLSLEFTKTMGAWSNAFVSGGNQALDEATRLANQQDFWDLLINPTPKEVFDQVSGQMRSTNAILPMIGASIGLSLMSSYIQTHLELAWRRVMTNDMINDWLNDKTFTRMQSIYRNVDNPEQRIQSDVSSFTGIVLGFPLGIINTVSTAGFYILMLSELSKNIPLIINGTDYSFPGYFPVLMAGYAAVGTLGLHMIGKSLVGLQRKAERYEADFRADMGRIKENHEAIALSNGEEAEKLRLQARFNPIAKNNVDLLHKGMQMSAYRTLYSQGDDIAPYAVIAPAYFMGIVGWSAVTQIFRSFGTVMGCFNWVLNNYSALANLKAITDRLGTMRSTMEQSKIDRDHTIVVINKSGNSPSLKP